MEIAYIGLGSNVDFPIRRVRLAIEQLKELPESTVLKMSSLYQSSPWGGIEQADFINAVVKLQTHLSPHELLNALLMIEAMHGRQRTVRLGPRTLDCDILLYGTQTIIEPNLTIPHPHMHQRAFVLVPLSEIDIKLFFHQESLSTWLKTIDLTGLKKISEEEVISLCQ